MQSCYQRGKTSLETNSTRLITRGVQMKKGTKCYNNVTVSIFACSAKRECSQTSRYVIGIFIVNRRMHRHLHAQERSEALIKSTIQLMEYKNRMVFMSKIQQLRSSETLSNFWQLKVLEWPLFIARLGLYTEKSVCPTSCEKMECPFSCRLRKFAWWPETRPGEQSHHSRSHR